MPLPATIVSLRIGKEEAYAVSALKKKDGGGNKQRKGSPATHDFSLPAPVSRGQAGLILVEPPLTSGRGLAYHAGLL